MIGLLIGLSVLVMSGVLGIYLDVKLHIENPPLYWALGAIGGILCAVAMIVGSSIY